MNTLPHRLIGALALAVIAATSAQAAPVYALAGNGSTLIRFDSATPGAVTTVGTLSGGTTNLDGLDFRPADGQLYGYDAPSGNIFRVNTDTGATTFVSTSTVAVTTPMGIDFNPVPDRLRVVSTGDNNLRINADTGGTTVDTTLSYAAVDANTGVNPNIIDAAYTNPDRNPNTGTQLFYIDHVLDTLVTTTNPNGGVLSTVGSLGFDTSEFTGFDIALIFGTNTAYAALTVGGNAGLYTINLATGAASLIGDIAAREIFGLAATNVPEPGSLALVGAAGLAAAFGLRRRRALQAAA